MCIRDRAGPRQRGPVVRGLPGGRVPGERLHLPGGPMNAVVMDLTLRGLLGRRRSLLLVILPVLLLLLAALIRWASGGEPLNTVNLVNAFAMGTLPVSYTHL